MLNKNILFAVIGFLIICMAGIQTMSAQEIIGRGIYYYDNMDYPDHPRGSWELNDDGFMYIWTEADVFKLTLCNQVEPPYEYLWERYIYYTGDPTNTDWWSPRDRGVGRMANDPRTVQNVEAEMYTYCWWSGPKDLGAGWTPYGFMSGREVIYLANGVMNGFSATLPADPGTYGGDPNSCGLCSNTGSRGWWMNPAPRVVDDLPGTTDNGGGTSATPTPIPTLIPTPTPTTIGHDLTGTWSTDWGNLEMVQSGTTVTGTYTHDSGKITGTLSGNTVSGTWSEAPTYSGNEDSGKFVWKISDDFNSFTGSWGYGSSSDGNGGWIGTKIA